MRFLFLFISFGIYTTAHSSNGAYVGAEQAAMGGYSVTLSNAFSIHNNIASASFLTHSVLGVSVDNRFLFANLYHLNTGYTWQNKKIGALCIGNSYTGIPAFYHHTFRLGYARKFGEQIGLGLALNHHLISIADNGSKQVASLNLGMIYQPVEHLKIGISINNPIKQKLEREYKETLKSSIQIGLAYHTQDKFLIALQFTKDLQYPLAVQLGTRYQIHDVLFLRAGVAINPTIFSVGMGLQLKQLRIDLASSWNIKLGISPQISLQYDFPEK